MGEPVSQKTLVTCAVFPCCFSVALSCPSSAWKATFMPFSLLLRSGQILRVLALEESSEFLQKICGVPAKISAAFCEMLRQSGTPKPFHVQSQPKISIKPAK